MGYKWPSELYPHSHPYPMLRIAGDYLGAFGFVIGAKYTVRLEEGKMVITLDPPSSKVAEVSEELIKAERAYRKKQRQSHRHERVWKEHFEDNGKENTYRGVY